MRKKKNSSPRRVSAAPSPTLVLYIFGMLIIGIPLFYLCFALSEREVLTVCERKFYANAMEHILAGLTLLTGGCYLVERVWRAEQKKE